MSDESSCSECGQALRGDEVLCPQCGVPVTHRKRRRTTPLNFIVSFVILALVCVVAILALPR